MTSRAEETIVLREQQIMQSASGLYLGLNLQMYSAMEDWDVYDFDLGHRLVVAQPTPPTKKKKNIAQKSNDEKGRRGVEIIASEQHSANYLHLNR